MNYSQDDLDGNTAVVTIAAHIASEKGIVVVSSAGNEGNKSWQLITSPADIINGIAVGSIQSDYALSNFSSIGPSADSRIKPDVVALGSRVSLIDANGNLVTGNGTSYSAPQVAGLIAGVWQAYPNFSYLEILDAIRMSATNVTNPNNEIGYGIPSFKAIKNYLELSNSTDNVSVYPNPVEVNGQLSVKFKDPGKVNSAQLIIYGSSGKKIATDSYSISWSDNIATIELQQLTQGLYLLKVINDSAISESFRIIKL
jgi:subtilisin family serine protease